MNLNFKAYLKKTKVLKQKQQAKLDKFYQNTQEKAQFNDIWTFAIGNRSINNFKDIGSHLISISSSNLVNLKALIVFSIVVNIKLINKINALRQKQKTKKQFFLNHQTNNIKRQKALAFNKVVAKALNILTTSKAFQKPRNIIPLPIYIKLIKPNK